MNRSKKTEFFKTPHHNLTEMERKKIRHGALSAFAKLSFCSIGTPFLGKSLGQMDLVDRAQNCDNLSLECRMAPYSFAVPPFFVPPIAAKRHYPRFFLPSPPTALQPTAPNATRPSRKHCCQRCPCETRPTTSCTPTLLTPTASIPAQPSVSYLFSSPPISTYTTTMKIPIYDPNTITTTYITTPTTITFTSNPSLSSSSPPLAFIHPSVQAIGSSQPINSFQPTPGPQESLVSTSTTATITGPLITTTATQQQPIGSNVEIQLG